VHPEPRVGRHPGDDELVGSPANLRDCRELRVPGGGRVRRDVLYRGDAPRPGDIPAPADVRVWPPRTVIDLRVPEERGPGPHPLLRAGTRVHHVPLGAAPGPTQIAVRRPLSDGVAGLYRDLAAEAAPCLARIVRIAATEPAPVLVHCTAGKDRTGIVLAILLRAVGVTREDVLADYARSNLRLVRLWARLAHHGVPVPADDRLLEVDPGNLVPLLDELDRHPAGTPGWLFARHVWPSVLARLRRRLIAEPAAG